MSAEQLARVRMRAVRRDGYRCSYRDAIGTPCGKPAGQVAVLDRSEGLTLDNVATVCADHRRP